MGANFNYTVIMIKELFEILPTNMSLQIILILNFYAKILNMALTSLQYKANYYRFLHMYIFENEIVFIYLF